MTGCGRKPSHCQRPSGSADSNSSCKNTGSDTGCNVQGGLVLNRAALILLLTPALLFAQTTIAGDWLLTEDVYGTAFYQKLTLKLDGTALTGAVGRRTLEGTVTGNAIRFTIKSD